MNIFLFSRFFCGGVNKTLTFGWYTVDENILNGDISMFKILVVEDDRDLNKTVCSFLNHSGYEAVGCLNANEAYDALYENVFDLRVTGAIRTCFLQSAFRSSCVKILANPTRIGCVFALADQKSDCRKSST